MGHSIKLATASEFGGEMGCACGVPRVRCGTVNMVFCSAGMIEAVGRDSNEHRVPFRPDRPSAASLNIYSSQF
jgi:hypothetical protein